MLVLTEKKQWPMSKGGYSDHYTSSHDLYSKNKPQFGPISSIFVVVWKWVASKKICQFVTTDLVKIHWLACWPMHIKYDMSMNLIFCSVGIWLKLQEWSLFAINGHIHDKKICSVHPFLCILYVNNKRNSKILPWYFT